MSIHLTEGTDLPEFYYDTPYEPQKSFYGLCRGGAPLFLVFLANFGHPITRTYLARYCETAQSLTGCRLAVVVRSKPQAISRALPPQAIPFELICDAEGALYDYFEVKQETSAFKYTSLDTVRILRQAKQQGYQMPKGQPQQLPLTLLVGPDAQVMLAHYGRTLTDFPEDGTALEKTAQLVLSQLDGTQTKPIPEPETLEEVPAIEGTTLPTQAPAEIPAEERPIQQGDWVDNTQQILLDFSEMPTLEEKETAPDDRYNTTGEIDIIGLMAQIKKATPPRLHSTLEDTLSGFEEIKL